MIGHLLASLVGKLLLETQIAAVAAGLLAAVGGPYGISRVTTKNARAYQ